MGLFNIFRKDNKGSATTDNGVLGPTFLDGLTEQIVEPKNLQKHEWRRRLKTPSGATKFKVKYFGQLHPDYQNLIVGKEELPPLVIAVEPNCGQEILIFDGCIHGYNAMFCDNYTDEQRQNRKAERIYQTADGIDTFELTISIYNGIDYDDEFSSEVGEDGLIELVNGTRVKFDAAKRNGFDTLQIYGTTDKGDVVELVSEELA